MSGLAALLAEHTPPGVYQWHSAVSVPDVRHAVEHAGWAFQHFDGWTTEDKAAFYSGIAASLGFPDYFGANLDALADCLFDLRGGDSRGVILLWDGWSPLARQDDATFGKVLEVMRERTTTAGVVPFAVVLRGDGPTLEVPELPIAVAPR